MSDLHTTIAQAIVDVHTSGLCPLDGPCGACDCFTPEHKHERFEAQYVLDKIHEAGYHITKDAKCVHAKANPPQATEDARWYVPHDHGIIRHSHSTVYHHDVSNPQASDHSGVDTVTWEEHRARFGKTT